MEYIEGRKCKGPRHNPDGPAPLPSCFLSHLEVTRWWQHDTDGRAGTAQDQRLWLKIRYTLHIWWQAVRGDGQRYYSSLALFSQPNYHSPSTPLNQVEANECTVIYSNTRPAFVKEVQVFQQDKRQTATEGKQFC